MKTIYEIHHRSKAVVALVSQFMSGAGDVDGEIIDTAGYEAAAFFFRAAEVNLQDMPIVLYESDDSGMAGATQVSTEELLGEPSLNGNGLDDPLTRCGYIGKKRFIRARVKSGIAVATRVNGVCMLVNSFHQPTPEQPVA